jgi:hypothetical protein
MKVQTPSIRVHAGRQSRTDASDGAGDGLLRLLEDCRGQAPDEG